MRRVILTAVAILTVAAALARPVETPLEAAFTEGETLDYDLSWLGMSGGNARMTIAPLSEESYRITSIGASTPGFSRVYRVRDEVESVVQRSNFSTLRYRKNLSEGRRHKEETTVVEEGFATRLGVATAVPNPVSDPLSLVYHIRTLDLTPGTTHRFTVYADGKVYTIAAAAVRRESIVTPAGTFKTVVVAPRMEVDGVFREGKGQLTIWYSDDERRLPVRIVSKLKVGAISATLRKVTRGVPAIEPVSASDSK